jgi:hypothetical protein
VPGPEGAAGGGLAGAEGGGLAGAEGGGLAGAEGEGLAGAAGEGLAGVKRGPLKLKPQASQNWPVLGVPQRGQEAAAAG